VSTELVVALCVAAWIYGTHGLAYLAREAEVFHLLRVGFLRLWRPLPVMQVWFAKLLGCVPCTSFWAGMAAYAALLPIPLIYLGAPAWLWWATPGAGVVAIGMADRMVRASPRAAADRLVVKARELFVDAAGGGDAEESPLSRSRDGR